MSTTELDEVSILKQSTTYITIDDCVTIDNYSEIIELTTELTINNYRANYRAN